MSLHRLGALTAAYSIVGLGFASVVVVSQRFLPYAAPPAPTALVRPQATPTPAVSPTPAVAAETDPYDNLETVLDLLHDDYLSPVNDRKLFGESFRLLKDYLKTQKIDTKDFPGLPAKLEDRKSLTVAWKSMIERVEQKVKGKFDRRKLVYLGLKAMLGGLNDPYCAVLEPREYRIFEEHMAGGNFSGIGVMIELDRDHANRVTVSQPIDGSPASSAGIKSGDVLVEIDGKATKDWDIEKAANHIRGPKGSTVVLTVLRPSEKKTLKISVVRDMIHVRSCNSKMAAPKIGYLQVQVFGVDTGKEFEEEVEKVRAKGAEALVIDLRNNGGGYVNAALDICSHFVPKGERVVSVVNPRLSRSEEHLSEGLEQIKWPTVVLVNRFSASASEITAGCFQDHKRGKLIGETTFGKASVQQVENLADGGAFKYTVAHYLTPSGKDIHRKGIKVDVPVKVSDKDKDDRVLEAAINSLKSQLPK